MIFPSFLRAKQKINCGYVRCLSGELLVGDPCYLGSNGDDFVILKDVPLGEYPVTLTIKKLESDRRISLVEIAFSNDKSSRKVELGRIGIDSASACISDKSGLEFIQEIGPDRIGLLYTRQLDLAEQIRKKFGISFQQINENQIQFDFPIPEDLEADINNYLKQFHKRNTLTIKTNNTFDRIVDNMDRNYQPTYSYGEIFIEKDINVISFSTGDGDGEYQVIGFYKNEKLTKIQIDFLV